MENQNYHSSIQAPVSAEEAYQRINEVGDWWTGNISGNTKKINDIFTVTFGATSVDFKIKEVKPYSKIVWRVTDCNLDWLTDKKEWKGTDVVFEITEKSGTTTVDMTHVGLVPGIECFDNCKKGWDFYIKESLAQLFSIGKGLADARKASH